MMHKLMEGFDLDYSRSKLSGKEEGITDKTIFVLATFLVALKGKEISSWC